MTPAPVATLPRDFAEATGRHRQAKHDKSDKNATGQLFQLRSPISYPRMLKSALPEDVR